MPAVAAAEVVATGPLLSPTGLCTLQICNSSFALVWVLEPHRQLLETTRAPGLSAPRKYATTETQGGDLLGCDRARQPAARRPDPPVSESKDRARPRLARILARNGQRRKTTVDTGTALSCPPRLSHSKSPAPHELSLSLNPLLSAEAERSGSQQRQTAMGQAAGDPAPAVETAKGRVAPPMPWRTRLVVLAAGYVTDATRRADGTVNRRLLAVLDKGVAASGTPRNGVASRDVDIDDPAVPLLRARLFYPAAGGAGAEDEEGHRPLPVVVFFHGGGFAYLSAASPSYDAACRRIARHARAAVLSVEYRRAPEHRYPAAYDDGLAALRFVGNHHHHDHQPPVDASRCFLAGDSAGGNIAHHVARRYALDPSAFPRVRLAGLIAIQPFFGGEERTPAELRLDGAPIVNVPRTDWMWRAFLPPGADRSHEACSPTAAVAGIKSAPAFPPVTVVVGGYDPLQDWQRRYCDALRREGKEVRVLEYPDAIHAFYVFPEFPDAKDLMLRIKEIVAGSE
nr:probable carboxylesterase 18 [Setaria viridis]